MSTGVIFDIDGVLIDVRGSYRRAIIETVGREHDATIEQALIDRFKRAGGFNNDWDLTTAVAIAVELQRDAGIAPHRFAEGVEAHGGGMEAAAVALIDAVGGTQAEAVTARVAPDRLRAVFQALYLGDRLYAELEGAPAPFDAPGFIHDEPVLVDAETVATLEAVAALGVVTGRPAAEAQIALARTPLDVDAAAVVTMDDEHADKPEPGGVLAVAATLGTDRVYFIGDTVDDMAAVTAAAAADPDRTYVGIGVTGAEAAEATGAHLVDAGAAVTVETVQEVPAVLADDGIL
jgi:HAD superfamily hydrolase (TIGR01548 family)